MLTDMDPGMEPGMDPGIVHGTGGATVFEAFLREGHVYLFKLALAIVEGIEAQLMTAQVLLAPPMLPLSLMVANCTFFQAYPVDDAVSRRTRLWSCCDWIQSSSRTLTWPSLSEL